MVDLELFMTDGIPVKVWSKHSEEVLFGDQAYPAEG
jgi:hypothetical protein